MTHFSDGFEVTQNVLAAAEILRINTAVSTGGLERSRAGARHLMRYEQVRDVAYDPRLITIAQRFLGAQAIPFRATLFDKSPVANWLVAWHQDTALPLEQRREASGWGPWSVKGGVTYAHAPGEALSRVVALRVHLDDSHEWNGPLRVIPGTHQLGVLSEAQIERLVRDILPVDCVAPAGAVVAMCPLILHASSKATTDDPRRVLHIEYIDSLSVGDGLQVAVV